MGRAGRRRLWARIEKEIASRGYREPRFGFTSVLSSAARPYTRNGAPPLSSFVLRVMVFINSLIPYI